MAQLFLLTAFGVTLIAGSTSTLPPLKAKPITGPWPQKFPAKDLCSNCGLCKSAVGVTSVTDACAFIGDGMSRAESLEAQIHGRSRDYSEADLSEAHWGVHSKIVLARGKGVPGAQWTGVATAVATSWLESGAVDAVVVAGSSDDASFGAPEPVLCRSADEVLRGRRVKPSLCPSLAVLDEVREDPSIRRLLFCGVGCAVQALRALGKGAPEVALGLDPDGLYVLGTHCVDNSPTPEAARTFVAAIPGVGEERANDVLAYEFMADFKVHARLRAPSTTSDEEVVKQAYMTLPPSLGIPSIAPSCFACFDYTNGLADVRRPRPTLSPRWRRRPCPCRLVCVCVWLTPPRSPVSLRLIAGCRLHGRAIRRTGGRDDDGAADGHGAQRQGRSDAR